jgi:hypothetical protein
MDNIYYLRTNFDKIMRTHTKPFLDHSEVFGQLALFLPSDAAADQFGLVPSGRRALSVRGERSSSYEFASI